MKMFDNLSSKSIQKATKSTQKMNNSWRADKKSKKLRADAARVSASGVASTVAPPGLAALYLPPQKRVLRSFGVFVLEYCSLLPNAGSLQLQPPAQCPYLFTRKFTAVSPKHRVRFCFATVLLDGGVGSKNSASRGRDADVRADLLRLLFEARVHLLRDCAEVVHSRLRCPPCSERRRTQQLFQPAKEEV